MGDFWNDEANRLDRPPPVQHRRIRKRWVAAALVGAFLVLLLIVPKPTPEQRAARKAEDAAAQAKAAAEEAQAVAAAKAALVSETKALWSEILEASQACEAAGPIIGDAAKAGDTYALYNAATRGATACRDGYQAISGLDAPASSSGDVEDAFEKGIDTCGSAMISRQIAYEATAKVADGDARPSAVADATDAMKRAGSGGMACAAAFVEAASKARVDMSAFKAAT